MKGQNENLTGCPHQHAIVINWHELVPKYRCNDCGRVLICNCEASRSVRLLPHQTKSAGGPGFWRVPVDGFAANICHYCRGIALPPAPRAALPNRKGKVQRYYWREINRMCFEKLAAWMDEEKRKLTLNELREECPEVVEAYQREALEFWKAAHKRSPRYETKERSQASLLDNVPVPVSEMRAPYEVHSAANNHPLGRFRSRSGQFISAERLAREHYEEQGWEVYDCERRLINALCAVFLSPVYQDPNDEHLITVMRGSTASHSDQSLPIVIHSRIPDDFGTAANYERRASAYAKRLDRLKSCPDVIREFERLIVSSDGIRNYLSVHDEELSLALRALEVVPRTTLCGMLDWVVRDFWNRHAGWPDLFIVRRNKYRFVEVKTRKDSLSQDQMAWFEWACGEHAVPCEILKILPARH